MASAKPACEQSVIRLCKSSFGAKAIECSKKIETAPHIADAREHRLKLAWFTHVARNDDRALELFGQRPDVRLRFGIEVGDREFGSRFAQRLGAAIGNAVLVGDPGYQSFFSMRGRHWIFLFPEASAAARDLLSRLALRCALKLIGARSAACLPNHSRKLGRYL